MAETLYALTGWKRWIAVRGEGYKYLALKLSAYQDSFKPLDDH